MVTLQTWPKRRPDTTIANFRRRRLWRPDRGHGRDFHDIWAVAEPRQWIDA